MPPHSPRSRSSSRMSPLPRWVVRSRRLRYGDLWLLGLMGLLVILLYTWLSSSITRNTPSASPPMQIEGSKVPVVASLSPQTDEPETPSDGIPTPIAKALTSSVVVAAPGVDPEQDVSHGSGTIIDAKRGLVLTARHVAEDLGGVGASVQVYTTDRRSLPAVVLAINQPNGQVNTDPDTKSSARSQQYPQMNRRAMPDPAYGMPRGMPWGMPPWAMQQRRHPWGMPGHEHPWGMPGQQDENPNFDSDLALVQIQSPPANLVAAPLAASSKLAANTEVWTIGAPGCRGVVDPENCGPRQLRQTRLVPAEQFRMISTEAQGFLTVADGLVLVQGGINAKTDQPAAPGLPGTSGGGLFTVSGELIGVPVVSNVQSEQEMPPEQMALGSVPVETARKFVSAVSKAQ